MRSAGGRSRLPRSSPGSAARTRAEDLAPAAQWLHNEVDAWRLAMTLVAKLPRVSPEIQNAFVSIWIESKHIPLSVGDRRITAAGLRVLMPGNYAGPPITLYRGAISVERRRGTYGFSWSTDLDTARTFAISNAHAIPQVDAAPLRTQGVLLRTVAPPDAVLLIRPPEGYYDEGEVIVDPFRLDKVALVERLNPEE